MQQIGATSMKVAVCCACKLEHDLLQGGIQLIHTGTSFLSCFIILRQTLVFPEAVPPATPIMNGASRAPSWLPLIVTSVEVCVFNGGMTALCLLAIVLIDLPKVPTLLTGAIEQIRDQFCKRVASMQRH